MFKKRNTDQKRLNLAQDVETIQITENTEKPQLIPQPKIEKSHLSKKIHKISSRSEKTQPISNTQKQSSINQQIKYGLIEKEVNPQHEQKNDNILMDLYVKKRMQEIQTKQKKKTEDNTANEILQMQKQYLISNEQKLADYDVKEIQKKLQKQANQTIKAQNLARTNYLKDLLENEHQKMEYASKKQLKMLRQEKERIEKELTSKYRESGRRHYVDSLKSRLF